MMGNGSRNPRQVLLCLTIVMSVLLVGVAGATKTVLTVMPWHGMGDYNVGGMREQLAREYEAARPDVEVEILERLPIQEFILKLMLMPEMPDVIEAHLGWFPELMQAGIPSALPAELDRKAKKFFFQPVLQPILHGGRLYAIPTEYQLYALGYNTRVWEEAGIVDPPETWADLKQIALKGTQRHPDGSIKRIGLRFSGIDSRANIHGEYETHTFMSFLWSNSGYYIDESGRPGFDRPEALETAEFLTEMLRTDVALANGYGGLDSGTSFMAVIPAWSRKALRAAMPGGFTITSTLIPYNRGTHATVQYGWGFIVPSGAKYPQEAWEFLDWLTMRTESNELTRAGKAMQWLGSVPTNPHDLRYRRELHEEEFWKGFIDGMNVARPEPHFPQILSRWKLVAAALNPVMRLQWPPAQGLAEAQQRISAALAPSVK
jgi:multiple sugar transport system substrate-binding protein